MGEHDPGAVWLGSMRFRAARARAWAVLQNATLSQTTLQKRNTRPATSG